MNDVDKRRLRAQFSRCQKTYRQSAQVQARMAKALITALTGLMPERPFPHILELGCGQGLLTDCIEAHLCFRHLTLVDIVPDFAGCHHQRRNAVFLAGDMEELPLPDADLVLAGAAFQWAANLPALLTRLGRLLSPAGILAFSTFGPENLREIAALTGRSLSYPPLCDLILLLQERGFNVLRAEEELVRLTFSGPLPALKHLRETGVNGLKSPRVWDRQYLKQFSQDYRQCFVQPDGQYPLSYHPIWVIAEKSASGPSDRGFS